MYLFIYIDYTCTPVHYSLESGSCEDILLYQQTTFNNSLLTYRTEDDVFNDGLDIDDTDFSHATGICKDAIAELMCLLLQPECVNGSQIPLCQSTCYGMTIIVQMI